jgi:hypothetical protein
MLGTLFCRRYRWVIISRVLESSLMIVCSHLILLTLTGHPLYGLLVTTVMYKMRGWRDISGTTTAWTLWRATWSPSSNYFVSYLFLLFRVLHCLQGHDSNAIRANASASFVEAVESWPATIDQLVPALENLYTSKVSCYYSGVILPHDVF